MGDFISVPNLDRHGGSVDDYFIVKMAHKYGAAMISQNVTTEKHNLHQPEVSEVEF